MTGLSDDLIRLAEGARGRFLLGIAGAPGSGKSTIAESLAAAVPGGAVLPMDGFHLDDSILIARGHRDRKGAPHTFDVGGFCAMLERVRAGDDVYAPVFDRSLELSRAAALEIGPQARIVVIEGNYLLHDSGGWEAVRPLLNACWFLDVPREELDRRLMQRWADHGKDPRAARAWIDSNDMPNVDTVMRSRPRADRVVRMDDPV